MHTVLLITAIGITLFMGMLVLLALRSVRIWSKRRRMQLLVLHLPLLPLLVAFTSILHFFLFHRMCLLDLWPLDAMYGLIVPLAMSVIALGAVVLGGLRVVLLRVLLLTQPGYERDRLQFLEKMGAACQQQKQVRVLLSPVDRPQALTYGVLHPVIVLSVWMLRHLDRHELEAVMSHELAHVAARDIMLVWLGTVLRDAFFYFPTSQIAYRQLVLEKELACDDQAVAMTGRPMALASALLKVSLYAAERGHLARLGAQLLVSAHETISLRVERLLQKHDEKKLQVPSPMLSSSGHSHVERPFSRLSLSLTMLIMSASCIGGILAVLGCRLLESYLPIVFL
ncbi:MAG: M56 family metallopeptidase [Ktedonobacteraceae bacterium]|nr:M56 family metallopeptidase [Ktedonobacteraceae bacterium]